MQKSLTKQKLIWLMDFKELRLKEITLAKFNERKPDLRFLSVNQ